MTQVLDCARGVLLAFADLGIYLPSRRSVIVEKTCSVEPLITSDVERFIDVCITVRLIDATDIGRLRLSATEARRLARSLDGSTPVPDEQAAEWMHVLAGAST